VVAGQGGTGTLVVGEGEGATSLFYERGELMLVLPHGPGAARDLVRSLGRDDDPPLGKGVTPAMAVLEKVPDPAAVAEALRRWGLDRVVALTDGAPLPFRWDDASSPAVSRLGRPIPFHQMLLGRLRRVDDWAVIEADVASLDQVCGRAPDLAVRLRRLVLDPAETAVLREVDGRRPVRAIVERTRLSTFEVFHVLYRLIQVHLVLATAPAPARPQPPVLVGGDDLATPLARHLAAVGVAPPTVVVRQEDAVGLVADGRARVVVVDARVDDAVAQDLAQGLRQRLESAHALVVAIIDPPDLGRIARLTAAGIDRVLSAPLPARDLIALLH
jgi:hypothetical protein